MSPTRTPILLGIFASMWIMRRLPANFGAAPGGTRGMIVVIALFAALLMLPNFFEIPLALSIVAAGRPAGAAAALLFAGPAVNISSLLTLGVPAAGSLRRLWLWLFGVPARLLG